MKTVYLWASLQIGARILPLKYHVTLGVGAPTARQAMVASFPSSTVRLAGAVCIMGGDATSHTRHLVRALHFYTRLENSRLIIYSVINSLLQDSLFLPFNI